MSKHKTDNSLTDSGLYARAQKLRPILREKQNDKCGMCEEALDIPNPRKWNIHHIDEDIANNTVENLVLLCTSCHRQIHWDNGTQPRHWDGPMKKRTGHSTAEFKAAGVSHCCFDKLQPWDKIKDIPGAIYKGLGYGYVSDYACIIKYGHTAQELADYLGVSRQRAHQLIKKNSPRIIEAQRKLDAGKKSASPLGDPL